MMLSRRQFTKVLVWLGVLHIARPILAFANDKDMIAAFTQIERDVRGRLGVFIMDTQTGRNWSYRAADRFLMCSTFKILAAAALLAKVDKGEENLKTVEYYTKDDLVPYSPETENHVDKGMSLSDLCAAAITQSDNTAGNIILKRIGGPEGLTAWLRGLGDQVTRLDRWEPDLNEVKGELDTTTPNAMATTLELLTTGNVLSVESRVQLMNWMIANTTGNNRIRKGLPEGWRIGDKTGTGAQGTTNDVAIIWPAGQEKPVIMAVYLTRTGLSLLEREAAIASVAAAFSANFRPLNA